MNNLVKNIAEKNRNDFPLFNGDINKNILLIKYPSNPNGMPQTLIFFKFFILRLLLFIIFYLEFKYNHIEVVLEI